MTQASSPLLRVRELKTWFDSPAGMVRAVDGVDFSLQAGKTLGIVGESGSGKSILSRSVMNILPRKGTVRAGGQVLFRGQDLYQLSPRALRRLWGAELAMIFQDPMTALNPVLTVGNQLIEALRLHLPLSRAAARQRAVELLQEVGIPAAEQRMEAYPHQLSGGMRQRVIIAIAISCDPSLLIADEPTTALDVTVQKQILDLLARQQQKRGMAMMLITHDLGVVASRSDHIAVMYAGRIVEYATAAQLFRQARHPYTEALMHAIPHMDRPAHTRLRVIPGRPPQLHDLPAGCRFAPRCPYARPRCLAEDPGIERGEGEQRYACFYPVGSVEGKEALASNLRSGANAAGLPMKEVAEEVPS